MVAMASDRRHRRRASLLHRLKHEPDRRPVGRRLRRELLREVQVYAAEVERLHVKPTGPDAVGVVDEAA
jgi:hypothetical protein